MNTRSLATPGIDTEPNVRVQLRRIFMPRWCDLTALAGEAVANWFAHNVPRLAASLTFYTLLSLAPLLIITIAVAGTVFGRAAAEGQLVWQIQTLIGHDGAQIVQTLLEGAQKPAAGLFATMVGVLTLFYSAGTVVAELRDALNTIWCVPTSPKAGWRNLLQILRDRTIAFTVVLGIGFLLLVSLAINAALSAIGDRFAAVLAMPSWLFRLVDFAITYLVIAVLFAMMYKWLPNLRIEWRDVALGAMLTSLLFAVGKYLIGLYLGTAGVASTYGAAGSLVVVLIWVYYSSQIFLLGAELTRAYAQLYGSHPCDYIGREVTVVTSIAKPESPAAGPNLVVP